MPFDENTRIGDLLDNAKAKAILDKHLNNITADPSINMVKGYSLKTLAAFPQAKIPQDKLVATLEELSDIED
ncbi:hypothetical protein LJC64_02655 [Ruminococcaceae bacterium OttesenSCG-928-A11]|nr:hypothetical protein [Ruminococcaceae bacterium OttesenSCG-928-A11]